MSDGPKVGVPIPHGVTWQTSALVGILSRGKPGDFISDATLSEPIGLDVRPGNRGYGYLQSAIRTCGREHRIHWARAYKAGGIRCLTPEEVVSKSKGVRRHVHKVTFRDQRRLESLDAKSMNDNQRREWVTSLSQNGGLLLFSSHATETKLLKADGDGKVIDPRKLLERLNGN